MSPHVSPLPPVAGFAVAVRAAGGGHGADPGPAPGTAFATVGTALPVAWAPSGQTWSGTVLAAGGDPRDAQPARAGDTAVLLAGELYNRHELGRALDSEPAELARRSDAELLLACLARYGPHAFRLLNGRYAALATHGGRVLAATDHAGGVPLYVSVRPGELVAATEAKALAAAGRGAPAGRPLPAARRVPGGRARYQVPAGAVLHVDVRADGPPPWLARTWQPPVWRSAPGERAALRAVRERLDGAVRARLRGGTPTAVLSGGVDSSGVCALAAAAGPVHTVAMGTDRADEFPAARSVASHLRAVRGHTDHTEIRVTTEDLLGDLPHTVWAAESTDPDIIEYLLPLVALYRRLPGPPRRVLTGYGADIPLGGMHRETERLAALDDAVLRDMHTFDGLNEMSPVLSAVAGHWTTHPYWDRDVLECLLVLESGLKRRHGRDKWVLREALADLLPAETVRRPKLGVHEGSGTTSGFSALLTDRGVPESALRQAKERVVRRLYDVLVIGGHHPRDVTTGAAVDAALAGTPAAGAVR